MDDWDKFEAENPETEKTDYENDSFTSRVYVDTAEAPRKKQREKNNTPYVTKKFFALMLVVCMVLSAAIGAGAYALAISSFGGIAVDKSIHTTNYNLAKSTGSVLSIEEIVAKNENSVVAIETESVSTDSWLRQYVTQGAGSGVIYREDGYIITNNHVIDGANSIKVTLYNGKAYDASLVATDAQTDVAVIKISETGLIPVTMGSMDQVSVGSLAVAIGNPLGTLSGTATDGIISALEREITIDGKAMSLIQTSASINPGNSGGGLFNQYGDLIGLVVAKSSGSDVEGLGFAIPVDKVQSVAESLIKNGYVEGRPAAGIVIQDLTDSSLAMQYGVSLTGVYITDVTGDNAKKAGLEKGDMIYYVDDVKITDSAVLLKTIQDHKIGDTVTFTVVRGSEILKCDVQLEDSAKFNQTADKSSQGKASDANN